MKFAIIAVLLFAFNANAGWKNQAVCEVKRINQQTEKIVSEIVEEDLVYESSDGDTTVARTVLVPDLAPSYKIVFTNRSTGRGDRLLVGTYRQSNDELMSVFRAENLINNSKYVTAESKYTARAKNIFLSDSDLYVFDISCYEKVTETQN